MHRADVLNIHISLDPPTTCTKIPICNLHLSLCVVKMCHIVNLGVPWAQRLHVIGLAGIRYKKKQQLINKTNRACKVYWTVGNHGNSTSASSPGSKLYCFGSVSRLFLSAYSLFSVEKALMKPSTRTFTVIYWQKWYIKYIPVLSVVYNHIMFLLP